MRSMVVVVRLPASNYSLPVGAVEPCGGVAPHHAEPLQILQSAPLTPRLNRSRDPAPVTTSTENLSAADDNEDRLLILGDAIGRGNARLCCCSVC